MLAVILAALCFLPVMRGDTAEDFRVMGNVESVKRDGVAMVIFSTEPGRDDYLVMENNRIIGEILLLDRPGYKNTTHGFFRCVANYRIYNRKDRLLLRAGTPVGVSIARETVKRDFAEKTEPIPLRFHPRLKGERDGREMVFIPGGHFVFGSNSGEKDEYPQQIIVISDFYIDVHEVSNRDFLKYVRDANSRLPKSWSGSIREDDLPVLVGYYEAEAYAKWAGKRLPTEKEWEKAARGDGLAYRRNTDETYTTVPIPIIYPWGTGFDPSKANISEFWESPTLTQKHASGFQRGYLPVGYFTGSGESPYGAVNMAGNAAEWTSSWYRAYEGNSFSSSRYGTMYKVVRGGAWYNRRDRCRVSAREPAGAPDLDRAVAGFRCAKDPTVLDAITVVR